MYDVQTVTSAFNLNRPLVFAWNVNNDCLVVFKNGSQVPMGFDDRVNDNGVHLQ